MMSCDNPRRTTPVPRRPETTSRPARSVPAATTQDDPPKRKAAHTAQAVLPHEPRRTTGTGTESTEMQTKTKLSIIIETLRGYARSKSPVFIGGETGTGKSRIAGMVHEMSGRAGLFVTVDCGAQPPNLLASALFGHKRGAFSGANEAHKGYFEEAAGGTVFLDEVGEMDLDAQKLLLRVIQEGVVRPLGGKADVKVDVRVITATNKDLGAEVKAGRFRRDLYARLVRLPVTLPPLRERTDEIREALPEICRKVDVPMVSDEIADALSSPCAWPENWRNVETIVEQAHWLGWGAAEVRAQMALLGGETPSAAVEAVGETCDPWVAASTISGPWTLSELSERIGLSKRQAQRYVARWVMEGRVEREGRTTSTRFVIRDMASDASRVTDDMASVDVASGADL